MKLEVNHIRALKGKRQLCELNVQSTEHATAAQAAGIEMIVSGDRAAFPERRAAAPDTHFCFGLVYGGPVTRDEAKRAAFDALNAGADSIYCAMHFDVVEALAWEGVPVVGHMGLVPQRARLTGFRAFGRTVDEARNLMDTLRRYENAGAFAVEMEVVAEPVATALCRATQLTVISMGSGGGCDVQYLFATDILGETVGHIPRHARVYDDFAGEMARLQSRRTAAFEGFRADVASGSFPATVEIVSLRPEERAVLDDFLQDPRGHLK